MVVAETLIRDNRRNCNPGQMASVFLASTLKNNLKASVLLTIIKKSLQGKLESSRL